MRLAGVAAAFAFLALAAGRAERSAVGKGDAGCPGRSVIKMKGNGWCGGCEKGLVDGEWLKRKSCHDGKSGQPTWCEHCVQGKPVNRKGCFKARTGGYECEHSK